jgi:molybdopterin-binding protein
MKISGRNKFKGKITKIVPGIVTAEVNVDIGNGNSIVGVITKASLDDMNMKVGDEVTSLIKATSVMFFKE